MITTLPSASRAPRAPSSSAVSASSRRRTSAGSLRSARTSTRSPFETLGSRASSISARNAATSEGTANSSSWRTAALSTYRSSSTTSTAPRPSASAFSSKYPASPGAGFSRETRTFDREIPRGPISDAIRSRRYAADAACAAGPRPERNRQAASSTEASVGRSLPRSSRCGKDSAACRSARERPEAPPPAMTTFDRRSPAPSSSLPVSGPATRKSMTPSSSARPETAEAGSAGFPPAAPTMTAVFAPPVSRSSARADGVTAAGKSSPADSSPRRAATARTPAASSALAASTASSRSGIRSPFASPRIAPGSKNPAKLASRSKPPPGRAGIGPGSTDAGSPAMWASASPPGCAAEIVNSASSG